MSSKQSRKPVFGRVVTAIVTPFDNRGSIDYDAAKKLIRHVQPQCDAVVVAGTTGEGPVLSNKERIGLVEYYKEHGKKSLKVLANVGTNNTAESARFAKAAAKAGADGLMVVGPYYNKPNHDGQLAHFTKVSDASDLPILLYNIPGRTGLRVAHDVIIELVETTHVAALKDATGDLEGTAKLRSQTLSDFWIYSGDDTLTLPLLAIGGCGVVSVASHLIGKDIGEMIKAFEDGDHDTAREIHLHFLELMTEIFMTTNPIPVKCALAKLGIIQNRFRLPMTQLPEELEGVLREYELI